MKSLWSWEFASEDLAANDILERANIMKTEDNVTEGKTANTCTAMQTITLIKVLSMTEVVMVAMQKPKLLTVMLVGKFLEGNVS